MDTRRASKRKKTSDDDGRKKTLKKTLLSDNQRLTEAVDKGDSSAVRDILENPDLKLTRPSLNNALVWAVKGGKTEIVQLLLNHNVNVDAKSRTGCLALVAAAEHGHLDLIKLLIKHGASVNSKNSIRKTVLMMAVEKGCSSAVISYLLYYCGIVDANIQDDEGKTALMFAVESEDYETVLLILIRIGEENIKIKDKNGRTAHDLARRNGFADVLEVLIQSCDLAIPPLSVAAANNNVELVRKLLEICPSCVSVFPFYGEPFEQHQSPLTTAMNGLEEMEWDGKIHCSDEIIELLLEAGVAKDDMHWWCFLTPLMFAAKTGAENTVKILLKYGADVNQHRPRYHTALMIAASKGYSRIVEMLIEAGTDLSIKDAGGDNVLGVSVFAKDRACTLAVLKVWGKLTHYDIDMMQDSKMLDILLEVEDRWEKLLKNSKVRRNLLCKAVEVKCYQLEAALRKYGAEVNGKL